MSQVPLGGRGVVSITVRESGAVEDVTSVQAILKNNAGTTIENLTYTNTDLSATADDGGATTLTNPSGTGTYQFTYTPPNDGTYSPPSTGLEFSIQILAVDEDGTADTGAISFFVVPADITVSFDSQVVASVVKRRAGLIDDVQIVSHSAGSAGDRLDLGSGPIYSIEKAYKNGTAITAGGTDYTWNTFSSSLTVVAAPAANDHYTFRVQRLLRNEVVDDHVDQATEYFLSKLRPFYDSSTLVTTPTFEMLVAMRATGTIKKETARGATLDNPQYRSGLELEKAADMQALAIMRGDSAVINASGTEVSRKDGSIVGGNKHGDGAVSGRLDMLDRAQKWTQVFLDLSPERDPDDALDPRAL